MNNNYYGFCFVMLDVPTKYVQVSCSQMHLPIKVDTLVAIFKSTILIKTKLYMNINILWNILWNLFAIFKSTILIKTKLYMNINRYIMKYIMKFSCNFQKHDINQDQATYIWINSHNDCRPKVSLYSDSAIKRRCTQGNRGKVVFHATYLFQ